MYPTRLAIGAVYSNFSKSIFKTAAIGAARSIPTIPHIAPKKIKLNSPFYIKTAWLRYKS